MIHQTSGNTHVVTWCHRPEGPNFTNTTVRNSNLHMGLPRPLTPWLLSSSWTLWRQNVIMKYKALYCSIQIAKCDFSQTNCRNTTCSFTVYQNVLAKYTHRFKPLQMWCHVTGWEAPGIDCLSQEANGTLILQNVRKYPVTQNTAMTTHVCAHTLTETHARA
jgi:hypothetical protein